MLEVFSGPDHVLAFRVSQKLTGDDYDRLSHELGNRLKQHQKIAICVDTLGLQGMTPAAIGKDLRYTFARLGEFQRFPRAAIITDSKWLRFLAGASDAAFPQMEIRTFEPSEREAALDWVAELPDQTRTAALRKISTTRPDTYGFVWNGRISVEDTAEFVEVLEKAIEAHGKVRLLGRIEHMGGIVPGAITDTGLLSLKSALSHKIDRYAIVGGPAWLTRYVGIMKSLVGIDLRHFDAAAESEAWTWLDAQPIAENSPHMLH